MAAILEIANDPALADQTAFNLAVWEKVLADPFYNTLEHRIETDAFGQIIMSPPPNFDHGSRQYRIGSLIEELLRNGKVATECPISTSQGVRAADTVWISLSRLKESQSKSVLTIAPEICVEVLSPSNTHREMAEKKSLYFEAGADEVWFCSEDGDLTFYRADAPDSPTTSLRCPDFPQRIEID